MATPKQMQFALLCGIGLTAVALANKGRGKSFHWYLNAPLYAYRLVRYRILSFPYRNTPAYHGEDRILKEMFPSRHGFCVEVGANDGFTGSNTFLFEKRGWGGLLIEANPEVAEMCRKHRPKFTTLTVAAVAPGTAEEVSFETVIGDSQLSTMSFDGAGSYHAKHVHSHFKTRLISVLTSTLDCLLEMVGAPAIDFITIDVEGYEWEVLQGFSPSRWQPKVIILERCLHEFDPRILAYMELNGYEHFRITPPGATHACNDWYRRSADNAAY